LREEVLKSAIFAMLNHVN